MAIMDGIVMRPCTGQMIYLARPFLMPMPTENSYSTFSLGRQGLMGQEMGSFIHIFICNT